MQQEQVLGPEDEPHMWFDARDVLVEGTTSNNMVFVGSKSKLESMEMKAEAETVSNPDLADEMDAEEVLGELGPRSSRNKTGFVGVFENGKKFKAVLSINGELKCMGNFDTPEDASRAYQAARKQNPSQHKEFTKTSGLPRGVYLDRRTGRYFAQISINGKDKYLGTFDTAAAASPTLISPAAQTAITLHMSGGACRQPMHESHHQCYVNVPPLHFQGSTHGP